MRSSAYAVGRRSAPSWGKNNDIRRALREFDKGAFGPMWKAIEKNERVILPLLWPGLPHVLPGLPLVWPGLPLFSIPVKIEWPRVKLKL